ncbi:MAG TPA: ATP-binding protein [Candidatus Binatia bacterium]|nr:ATP-binding protein [Candidatus Binatia bacterium]
MSLELPPLGYPADVTPHTSELRLPADRHYVIVAKRAAAGFAAVAGLDVEALDDLVIAVAQACENTISLCERAAGPGCGQIRLVFSLADRALEVQVKSSLTRAELEAAARRRAAAAQAALEARLREADEMALRVMGLFVDDFGYRVDERTGGMRVRLTKYLVK